MKRDFFLRSKIFLAVSVVISVVAFLAFGFSALALGFLVGAVLAISLCTHPKKVFKVGFTVQLLLLLAIFAGLDVWILYPVFFIVFPMLLYMVKDADFATLIGSYAICFVFPLVAALLAWGIEFAVYSVKYF